MRPTVSIAFASSALEPDVGACASAGAKAEKANATMTQAIQIKRKRRPFLHSSTGPLDWNFGFSAAGPDMRRTLTRRFYSGTCSLTNLLIFRPQSRLRLNGFALRRNLQKAYTLGITPRKSGKYSPSRVGGQGIANNWSNRM